MGNGFLFFDSIGNLMTVNRQARRMMPELDAASPAAFTLGQFISLLFERSVDLDRELLRHSNIPVDEDGDAVNQFSHVFSPDSGSTVLLAQARETADGGTVVVLIDISSLKDSEARSRTLERRHRELINALEAMGSGIAILDTHSEPTPIVFFNRAFSNLLRLSEDEVSHLTFENLVSRFLGPMERELMRASLQDRFPETVEFKIEAENVGTVWLELRLTLPDTEDGTEDLAVMLLSDITRSKLQEAALIQSQKLEALGQLAGGVAHDFNNILSIIDGYARMTAAMLDKPHPAHTHLEKIRQAVGRASALTRQLLAFGRHRIVTERVTDLTQLAMEQRLLLRPLLDSSIELVMKEDARPLFVEVAPDVLHQILMNLVVNSRDAMPDGGRIVVDWGIAPEVAKAGGETPRQYAYLSVTDTGTGIDPAILARIFDPFFTTKEPSKGTGLGLSMVYGMVRQVGGTIDVHSTPGEGTTMTVTLPLCSLRMRPQTELPEKPEDIRLDGYTILVAEDEPDLLEIVSTTLESLGMTVLRAKSGNEALARQDEYDGAIDFLLTDVVMGNINGVRLAELMREVRPETNVIFMSGYPSKGQSARVSIPEGAVSITKPISYDHLALLLHIWASRGKPPCAEELEQMTERWQSLEG